MGENIDPATVEKVAKQAKLQPSYMILMASSGVLAAVAFLSDSVPLLVGAMVVSPVFAPLALSAFGVVAGNLEYALRGLATACIGIAVSAFCAFLAAWALNITQVFPVEANLINKPLLEERVSVGWYSVVAAVAAGVAGAIAMAKGKLDTLVGVVAALALVPAAAASAIAFLSGDHAKALGGLMLLLVNMTVTVGIGALTLLIAKPHREP